MNSLPAFPLTAATAIDLAYLLDLYVTLLKVRIYVSSLSPMSGFVNSIAANSWQSQRHVTDRNTDKNQAEIVASPGKSPRQRRFSLKRLTPNRRWVNFSRILITLGLSWLPKNLKT
ncbi:Uncharacterised protein [Grimontia hollisae]|uniref:Uncharacterized protein n=1 Tax=Grimontia hollisae TaxID=673 RepID=A0A377J8L0_GRIHO|nr:Uncharacterised protein [Grimontia hollisae]